jgi:hypothetical protein
VDWIGLAQDGDKCRALVNAVMKLRVHKVLGIYCVATQLVASQVVLSFIKLVYGDEQCLRGHLLCNHSRTSQHFMEP